MTNEKIFKNKVMELLIGVKYNMACLSVDKMTEFENLLVECSKALEEKNNELYSSLMIRLEDAINYFRPAMGKSSEMVALQTR